MILVAMAGRGEVVMGVTPLVPRMIITILRDATHHAPLPTQTWGTHAPHPETTPVTPGEVVGHGKTTSGRGPSLPLPHVAPLVFTLTIAAPRTQIPKPPFHVALDPALMITGGCPLHVLRTPTTTVQRSFPSPKEAVVF